MGRSLLPLVLLLLTPACATSTACRPDPIGGPEHCYTTSDSMGAAAVHAGAAAATWAAVGCTVNGCIPPMQCNAQSKLCEPIPCKEQSACPTGYACDLTRNRCQ